MASNNVQDSLISILNNKIQEIAVIDVHTHLNTAHLGARGLHDILLYHMVISDLYSAGCPSGARLSDEPDRTETNKRIIEAIPYIEHIQNTSCYWLLTTILNDLYGWKEPITLKNWQILDEKIRSKAAELEWPRTVFKRANIFKACTEYPLRGNGFDDLFYYALEWAFFTRTQWSMFDAPLYELEYAWQFDRPCRPLPVQIQNPKPVKKKITSIRDIKEAMAHYCNCIPFDKIVSTAHHISTDIDYDHLSDEQVQKALDNRTVAGKKERDIYASYLFDCLLNELEKKKSKVLFQFSFGAEPLPFETDSRLNQTTIKQLSHIISRHPGINFQCFLSSKHANQSMCTLCRQLPNLSLAGYWWHNFFPSHIEQVIDERLDMLPSNKQVGYFSDAYCVEWMYAKSKLVRFEHAKVLAKRIERSQYSVDKAIEIAHTILRKTPEQLYSL